MKQGTSYVLGEVISRIHTQKSYSFRFSTCNTGREVCQAFVVLSFGFVLFCFEVGFTPSTEPNVGNDLSLDRESSI